MRFSVLERALLLNVLPAEGDITTLRIVRTLREELSFSEQEHADLALRQEDGKVFWDVAKAQEAEKEIEVGAKAKKVVANVLKKMSDSQRLAAAYVDLYDRFVEE